MAILWVLEEMEKDENDKDGAKDGMKDGDKGPEWRAQMAKKNQASAQHTLQLQEQGYKFDKSKGGWTK